MNNKHNKVELLNSYVRPVGNVKSFMKRI